MMAFYSYMVQSALCTPPGKIEEMSRDLYWYKHRQKTR